MYIFSKLRQALQFKHLNAAAGLLFATVFLTATLFGTACSSNDPYASLSTDFPMTVTDDLGRTITFDKVPQRIVSLAPSNTEILFGLGLGDKIVGNTFYCDYPIEAQNIVSVGGYSDIDVEVVVALDPDLILAEDIHKANVIPALEALGFKVYALVPHNLDEIMDSVITIGRLTGTMDEARAITDDMRRRIKFITDKTSKLKADQKPNVLYVLWTDPIMSSGINTPIYDMITKAGGVSVIQDSIGFPTLSLEYVIAANPKVVICDVDSSWPGGNAPLVFMQTDTRLKDIDARASKRVYGIDASLTNRPVPRILDGLEWIAAMIHPELFPQFVEKYMAS
ncbi:MAG: cobalamin-binding protein [Dehalococcoidia bacterium]|nr:cobalamin-binding protein [Dehalococcoidia bacterium]